MHSVVLISSIHLRSASLQSARYRSVSRGQGVNRSANSQQNVWFGNAGKLENLWLNRGIRGAWSPGKKIEIWGLQTAGNVLKLSILPSPRYFASFKYFTISSDGPFWLLGGAFWLLGGAPRLPTGLVLKVLKMKFVNRYKCTAVRPTKLIYTSLLALNDLKLQKLLRYIGVSL